MASFDSLQRAYDNAVPPDYWSDDDEVHYDKAEMIKFLREIKSKYFGSREHFVINCEISKIIDFIEITEVSEE